MTDAQDEYTAPGADLYGRLAHEFETTFTDRRGGVDLEYITGEQATTRLNETLGFLGWSFRIVEHGIHPEADECWALGELTVHGPTGITRQQFGSQKIKRSRSSGTPLDIGFDLKGAATDSLKKCASLIGVGLYLWKKEPQVRPEPAAAGPDGALVKANTAIPGGAIYCEDCGDQLTETKFKDGTTWAPAQLAVYARRKHSRMLCMTHYREANQAQRRAEEAVKGPAF